MVELGYVACSVGMLFAIFAVVFYRNNRKEKTGNLFPFMIV